MLRFLPVLFLCFFLGACASDNEEDRFGEPDLTNCDTIAITYDEHVGPILATNCATSGCHNAASRANGIVLESYSDARNLGQGGENSSLYGSIAHLPGWDPMPQGQPRLPDCDVEQVRLWVTTGMPEN